jgi:hypothetical protein
MPSTDPASEAVFFDADGFRRAPGECEENAMTARTVELAELGERAVADLLREVAEREEILTVELPNGKRVSMQALPDLEPLPELEGYVEEGWKDAIYP